jgi:bacteriocin biosynthesis cyclodehydratase domain-containing protein
VYLHLHGYGAVRLSIAGTARDDARREVAPRCDRLAGRKPGARKLIPAQRPEDGMARTIAENTRVRLRPEFAVVPLADDKVLLRSPDQAVRVSVDGMSAPRLARVLSGLDGQTLSSDTDTRRSEVRQLVDGLLKREIVEIDPGTPPTSMQERCFARFHDDAAACTRRLSSSRVLIRGRGAVADALAEEFRRAGVGLVTRSATSTTDGASLLRGCLAADLAVLVSDTGDGRSHEEEAVNDLAIDHGFTWCPVRIFGGEGFVGPLFVAGDGPCLGCVVAREESNWVDPDVTRAYLDHTREASSSLEAYGRLPGFVAIVSAWATIEGTKYLSRFAPPAILGHVLRIDFLRCTTRLHRVLRLPRCGRCSPLRRRPSVNSLLYAKRVDRERAE